MNQDSPAPSETAEDHFDEAQRSSATTPDKPQDSYIKLAMRNMVRKSGTSLRHFALTSLGLVAVLVALAYLSR
ncbi:MAG TPA: DUF3285 domain-containing protein [Candidatus Caenarcaniphilales bacterium]